MLRAIGRMIVEFARAIDTGHAIRHGVILTESEKAGLREPAGVGAPDPDPEETGRLEPTS